MNNPYDDIGDVERDFWHDEPTRVLRRVPSRAPTASRSRQHLAVIQTPARQNGFSLQRLTTTSDPFVVRMAMMMLLGLFAVLLALAAKRSGSDVFRTAPSIGAVAVPSGAAAVVPVAAVINVPAVPAPAAGGTITLNEGPLEGLSFKVKGQPRRLDPDRLVWTIEAPQIVVAVGVTNSIVTFAGDQFVTFAGDNFVQF